jgi:arylsulfatase A-like enzyme
MNNPATVFWANFTAALFVNFVLKIALIYENINGSEGKSDPLKMIGKSFLLFGNDIIGALLLSALVFVLIYPVTRVFKPVIWYILCSLLQGFHALFGVVSFYVFLILGGPLDKALIDLSFLNQEPVPGNTSPFGAFAASVHLYINTRSLTFLFSMIFASIIIMLSYRFFIQKINPHTKKFFLFILAAETVMTTMLVPYLRNGEIYGIRMHTFGLEKSAFRELFLSYAKIPVRAIFSSSSPLEDPFIFNMKSIADPGKTEENPLMEAVKQQTVIPSHTNVIIVVMESAGAKYLEGHRNPMPFLQSLANKQGSISFSQHYSIWPQTMKVFFSILCSEMPYSTYEPITSVNPSIPCISLSEILHNSGYSTALFNSSDLGYDRQMRFYKHRKFDLIRDMYDMPHSEGSWKNSWGVDEKTTVRAILEWIDSRDARRNFFVFYPMIAGHHPYECPGVTRDPSKENDFNAYLESLKYVDDSIKELFQGLEKRALLNNTLIAVFSDHGEAFGTHEGVYSHGNRVYEEAMHVPCIITGPQFQNFSGSINFPTNHLDIAPSLLGLTGIKVPWTMKGRDLTASNEKRLLIYGSRPPEPQIGLRDGNFKFIINDSGSKELYDLTIDPDEENNVVESYPSLAGRFETVLKSWQIHSKNLIENYSSIIRDKIPK